MPDQWYTICTQWYTRGGQKPGSNAKINVLYINVCDTFLFTRRLLVFDFRIILQNMNILDGFLDDRSKNNCSVFILEVHEQYMSWTMRQNCDMKQFNFEIFEFNIW